MKKQDKEKLDSIIKKYEVKDMEVISHSQGSFLKIDTYKVNLNNGETIYRDRLVKGDGGGSACIVVPFLDEEHVIMVVQPRVFAFKGALMDFPAGYIEKDEDITKAALRELEEETGYRANKIKEVVSYFQDEGVGNSIVHIFFAKDLVKVGNLKLDKDEYLEPLIINVSSLDELVKEKYIYSGGSQLAIANIKLERSNKDA